MERLTRKARLSRNEVAQHLLNHIMHSMVFMRECGCLHSIAGYLWEG